MLCSLNPTLLSIILCTVARTHARTDGLRVELHAVVGPLPVLEPHEDAVARPSLAGKGVKRMG